MIMLVFGCIIFFGIHSVQIALPALRARMVARMGKSKWMLLYSAIAGIGLALIIIGYGAARHESTLLYLPPTWGRSVAIWLMLPVFPLLLAAYLPGKIQSRLRHPMLLATLLWATAHLLANGTVADAVLFGSFLVWALAELLSFLYRPEKRIRRLPAKRWNDVIAIVGGLVIYGLFAAGGHQWLTGIALM